MRTFSQDVDAYMYKYVQYPVYRSARFLACARFLAGDRRGGDRERSPCRGRQRRPGENQPTDQKIKIN